MNHPQATCTFALEMVQACKSFESFYLRRHSGRKLTWQAGLGNADVRARFKTKTHDLNVSTYALVILLLFEDLKDNETLTYQVGHIDMSFTRFNDVFQIFRILRLLHS